MHTKPKLSSKTCCKQQRTINSKLMRKTLPFHFRWGAILMIALIVSKPPVVIAAEVFESANAEVKAEVTVKGKITDQDTGEPLPGVTILEKGTANGTISDFNGDYKITVNSESILVFSFVGYTNQEETVGGRSVIDVVLAPDVQALEEIVVIGYGEVKRADLTGSVVSMDSRKIASANKIDAASALQGQVPGVVIQRTDNKPGGGGMNIRIRGASTINTNETASQGGFNPGQNPLFIVDGIFVDDISFLNPADIDRMDVLKDASATAIYGSRGSNGVVIIKTKRGASGKLSVRYNNYVGVKQAYHLPTIQDGPGYVEYLKDVVVGNQYASGNYNYTRDDVVLSDWLDAEELQNVADGVSTNWVDLILQNGKQSNHTVDLSGGSDNTQYGFGFGYTSDEGNIKNENFNRYNLRANISSDLAKWLNISYANYVTVAKQNSGTWESFRSAYRLKPIGKPYNDDGSLRFYPTSKETQITNPLFDLDPDNMTKETKYLQYMADIALTLKPVSGLSLTTKFSPNVKFSRYGEYRGLYTKEVVGNQSLTRAQVNNSNYLSYTWDNILNYQYDLNQDHKFNATFVYSQYLQKAENYYTQTRGFATDSYSFYNLDAGATINQVESDYAKQSLESYTGRLNYTLMDRYLFTFTGRYDGSSILAEGNKWAFFPSAAFAWQLNEESFMQSQNIVSDAKVRLSYGQTGNNGQGGGLGPLKSQSLLASSYTTIGTGAIQTAYITGLANKDLTWERTTEVNLGFDFGILKNRLFGSIDLYNRKTRDIIFYRPVPLVSGFNGTFENVGEATNKGVEFSLNSVNIEKRDLKWTTNVNFAHNKNTIDKLYGDLEKITFNVQGASLINRVGNAVGSLYDYEFDGIWQLDEKAQAEEYGQKPGQVKVVDQNNDGVINDDDRTVIGQVTPKWTGGIANTVNFKNFDFTVFVFTSQGAKMLSNFHSNLSFPYDGQPSRLFNAYDVNYWTPENATNDWYQPGNGGSYQQAIKYKDVSYTKVGYITLGYSLPNSLIDRVGLANLRVYATVQNPMIFTKYDGWDPENAMRNSWGAAFMSRTYMTGLSLNF